jgi:hypothetical protein
MSERLRASITVLKQTTTSTSNTFIRLRQVVLANHALATPRTATSEIALLYPNDGLWRMVMLAYEQHPFPRQTTLQRPPCRSTDITTFTTNTSTTTASTYILTGIQCRKN